MKLSPEISTANQWFELYRSCATINLPASSACSESAENWGDAMAPSCFKVQKSSSKARSRRHGLSFPARGQVIFPGCAAKAALKASLEKGPTEGSTIGSNDVAGYGLPVARNRPKDVAEDVIPTFARGGIGTILAQ